MTLLRTPTRVSAAADRPASYGNQTISSTRPSCWIQISTVDVINIAADHQMFMTLTGELSWQRLRRSVVDFHSKKLTQKTKKSLFESPFMGLRGNVCTPSMARWKAHYRLYIHCNWTFSLSLTVETLWAEIRRSRRFSTRVGHHPWIFDREGGIVHQPLLVSEN